MIGSELQTTPDGSTIRRNNLITVVLAAATLTVVLAIAVSCWPRDLAATSAPKPTTESSSAAWPQDWSAVDPQTTQEPTIPMYLDPEPRIPAEPTQSVQSGQPNSPATTTPAPNPTESLSLSFTALTGNGCPDTAASGSYAAFRSGSPITSVASGWHDGTCAGRYWSVPMSGRTDSDDAGTFVVWWFDLAPNKQARCDVWVFVPSAARDTEAAGSPTHYWVTRGRDDTTQIGTFAIDQRANRNAWMYGGRFTTDSGRIAVRLVNRGSGASGARHAAAQIEVGCGT